MNDKPVQAPPKWSQLDLWHFPDLDDGRYDLVVPKDVCVACRMCGSVITIDYAPTHDAYHEEQGY